MTKPPAGMPKAIGDAKSPFAGPAAVLAYLARYAIADRRLIRLDDLGVPFHHKDYRRDDEHGIA